jgi:hypothetical protein
MNWFRKLWDNPNVHIFVGTVAGGAATAVSTTHPQYAGVLASLAAIFGVNGIMTPDVPKAPVTVGGVAIPGAVSGSLHTNDYTNIALAVIAALSQKKDPPPAQ